MCWQLWIFFNILHAQQRNRLSSIHKTLITYANFGNDRLRGLVGTGVQMLLRCLYIRRRPYKHLITTVVSGDIAYCRRLLKWSQPSIMGWPSKTTDSPSAISLYCTIQKTDADSEFHYWIRAAFCRRFVCRAVSVEIFFARVLTKTR